MPANKTLAGGCLFILVLFAGQPALAADEGFASGLKWGLEKTVGRLTEIGYKTNCKAKNLDYKSDDSWYCGAFAALSGQDKKEWEERLAHDVAAIRDGIAQIKSGIAAIQDGQKTLYNQNQQILVRLDEIGPETAIGKSLSRIRVLFNEQYTPLFTGQRPFAGPALVALARQIIFVDKIDQELGIIDDQLTHADFGKETLLRSYARRMSLKMAAAGTRNLDPAYDYLESVTDDLLAEQRKGYVLYTWAAVTLESVCKVDSKQCKDAQKLPHTAVQYRDIFAQHVRGQVAELNAALEWLVLAHSDPHSRQANFLHPDAARLFRRNDLFSAGNLGIGYGIVGRVISMGERQVFDGKLQVAGAPQAPAGAINSVATSPGALDWWRATGAAGVYDEVHFTDRWQIYHYHLPGQGAGRYKIDSALPYKPSDVAVETVTLNATTKVPFGSFVAIARAGGGYALLSGSWVRKETNEQTAIGDLEGRGSSRWTDFAAPYAGILYGGRLSWDTFKVGKDQHVEATQAAYAVSQKQIRFADGGGELTLHADFGDPYSILCPGGACADFDHNMVLARLSDFKKAGFGARDAEMVTRTAFLIDTDSNGSNGIQWLRNSTFSSAINERLQAGKESAKIRVTGGTPYNVILGGSVKMNVQTSGPGNTSWLVVAIAKIDNAYVTR